MSSTIETYVVKYWPLAVRAGGKFNVNPVVILAQGGNECGYGTSYSAVHRNNHFGITAYGAKNQYWDGSYELASSGLKMRKYKSVENSFFDFARLISTNYPSAAKQSYNIDAYALAISQSKYIQDSDNREQYRKNIISIAKSVLAIVQKKNLNHTPPIQV